MDTYETIAQRDPSQTYSVRRNTDSPRSLKWAEVLNSNFPKNFNIALEDKVSITKSDLLDGQQWQETGSTNGSRPDP